MCETFDVSIIMPMYSFIDKKRFDIRRVEGAFEIELGKKKYEVKIYTTTYEGVQCYFVESYILSNKKHLYGYPSAGYKDNDLRFGLFCKAVVAFAKESGEFGVLHLNDWQSALCALFVKEDKTLQIKTLFTIHNFAYQGVFGQKSLERLGLSDAYYNMDALEFYNNISFMKAGIAYSEAITTVSPNYAKEILTPEFGCGLEGFLEQHAKKLKGILNGVDLSHFSPKSDSALVQNYDASSYEAKFKNKTAYLNERDLKNPELPLFVFIGRFTWQKGVDLLVASLKELSKMKLNLAILGDGEAKYHKQIKAICDKHTNIDLYFGYDEALSHRMYASADFLLMPSLFEPCGLNQLISMGYGVIPIVSSVGGLKDSVHPIEDSTCHNPTACGYGICFDVKEKKALQKSVKEALKLYKNEECFEKIVVHNMLCDFSWKQGAKEYAALYNTLMR